MIRYPLEVILCYKEQPGKEINDNEGEFPQILDFLFLPFCQPPLLALQTRTIRRTPHCTPEHPQRLEQLERFERLERLKRWKRR